MWLNQQFHSACQQKAAWSTLELLCKVAVLIVNFRKPSGPTPGDGIAPNYHRLWKLHSGLQKLHACYSFWDFHFQIECNICFHLKKWLWAFEQQPSSGETLQEWLHSCSTPCDANQSSQGSVAYFTATDFLQFSVNMLGCSTLNNQLVKQRPLVARPP